MTLTQLAIAGAAIILVIGILICVGAVCFRHRT